MIQFVSICIPAYRQPELLERCLASIARQTYKLVEVLVSDDTPDDGVKIVIDRFTHHLSIRYQHNPKPLGAPANWNAALQMAKGDYVLLLHHDDELADPDSLAVFLQPFFDNPSVDFVFGRNPAIKHMSRNRPFSANYFNRYYSDPERLLAGNTLGAPSNVMLRSSVLEWYNPKYKWVVDIEMYIRLFRKNRKFYYVDRELVRIGIHEGQVSNECVDNYDVLLYENISVAADKAFRVRSLPLFDFYWRLLRNAGVPSAQQLTRLGLAEKDIPPFVLQMIHFQHKIPKKLLQLGFISKSFMATVYAWQRLTSGSSR